METELASTASVIKQLACQPGIVMLLGAIDSGKTTFCTRLANEGLASGLRVAVVDTDVGQSEIGPPTTLGFGWVNAEIETLHDIAPAGLYFVGVTSPARDPGSVVDGTRKLVHAARSAGASLILVDTSGMVAGSLARMLKLKKVGVIKPDRVVAIQTGHELEHILHEIKDPGIEILRVPVHRNVQSKSPDYRAQRRSRWFAEYFRSAKRREYNLLSTRLTGTDISIEDALSTGELSELTHSLGVPVLHAQVRHKELVIVCDGVPAGVPLELAAERLKADSARFIDYDVLRHLVVGLRDRTGDTLGIGILEGIDFTVPEIHVITPVLEPDAVRTVTLGRHRVLPSGTELGPVGKDEL